MRDEEGESEGKMKEEKWNFVRSGVFSPTLQPQNLW